MIRLHVVAEGQTEESFVNRVLMPHLARFDVITDVHCVTTRSQGHRVHRGGSVKYEHLRKDLTLWMKQDQDRNCRFTTMVDFYRVPSSFPGFNEWHSIPNALRKVRAIEAALARDLDERRFIPYVQLYEFETLLYSDLSQLEHQFPSSVEAIRALGESVEGLTPEEINDGDLTSPSKRLIRTIPEYAGRKAAAGPLTAEAIGVDAIRRACPHFNQWITGLETCQTLL